MAKCISALLFRIPAVLVALYIVVQGSTLSHDEVLESTFRGSTVNCSETACYVELYEEQYNISNAVILEDIEIFIVGVGKGADIVCTFHDSEERFSFLFARNKKLVLQNLQFANCPMPVLVEQAEHVEIRNSTFRYFTEAVFDIFNCHVVNILGCVFEHNRGSGQSTDSNRGNTGCLAIGYKDLNSSVNRLWVEIRDSVFRDNIATADVLDVRTQDTSRINLLGSNVYRGRGGAIGLFFHNINVTTLITGCSFVNNKAFYGGGVYIAYGGPSAQVSHKATIRGCDFFENEAEFGGAGILAAFRVSGNNNNPMITDIIDSNFTGNKAVEVAGGVGITVADSRTDEGVQARIQGCIFRGNEAGGFGSAVRFTVLNIFFERNAASAHEVINCTFLENSGPHGTLGVAHVPLRLSGNVIFENNTGHSLQVIGSIVTIDGDVRFVGNDARRDGGGALYISAFGQILMKENSNMLFENNNGSTGSAIVVSTQMISSTYSKLLFNTQCFLLYEDMSRAPSNWSNVSIIFKGNLADLGADVFANSLETCAWFSFKAPFFDVTQFQNWTIFNQTADSIQTNPESVVIESEESVVQFSSGHPTSFNPVLRDQFGRGTVGTLQLVYTSDSNHSVGIQSQPSVLVVSSNHSVDVTFSLVSEEGIPEDVVTGTLEALDLARNGLTSINISMGSCPPGQSLRPLVAASSIYECQCNNADQSHIVLCDNKRNAVILQLGYWSVYSGSTLHGYICPSGYCRCDDATSFSNRVCYPSYNISQPETQCVCGRQGILCGRCTDSSGMTSLYLHCEDSCHPAWWTTFVITVLLEGAIVAVIIFFNIKLPSWMIPILFYIKMASYYSFYFPPTFEEVGQYLYFLSSLLSLYFPYDFCIPGANALGVFAARFMPLFVSMVVWPIAWMLRRKRKGISSWSGSVTLVFLLFSHVMYTALEILHCPLVYDTRGELTPRWYYNGEQRCFHGSHAPLGLLAIAILVGFIALCVLLIVTISQRVQRRWIGRLRMVFVKEIFGEKWAWWILVEVARQCALLLILVAFPRSTIVPLLALAVMMYAYGYCKPYKDAFSNYLEFFLLSTLSLLIALSGNNFLIENSFVLVDSISSQDDCPREELRGITKLSLILLPFYYLPVLISVVAVGCYYLAKCLVMRTKSMKLLRKENKSIRQLQSDLRQPCAVTEYELTVYNN